MQSAGPSQARALAEDDWETDWESSLSQLSLQNGEGVKKYRDQACSSVQTVSREGSTSRSSPTLSLAAGRSLPAGDPPCQDWQKSEEDEEKQDSELPFNGKHILQVHDLLASHSDIWLERQAAALSAASPPIVRRLDDTAALLVFADPAAARSALSSSATLKLTVFSKEAAAHRHWSAHDLLPPKARPRSSPVVARRLIAHALNISDLPDKEGEQALRNERTLKANTKAARAAGLNAAWGD